DDPRVEGGGRRSRRQQFRVSRERRFRRAPGGEGRRRRWRPRRSDGRLALRRSCRSVAAARSQGWRQGDREMSSLVEIKDVHKHFTRGSERIDVLKGVNLEIPQGDFLALMGPSGSGKTTLLNLMGGLDLPTGGSVSV